MDWTETWWREECNCVFFTMWGLAHSGDVKYPKAPTDINTGRLEFLPLALCQVSVFIQVCPDSSTLRKAPFYLECDSELIHSVWWLDRVWGGICAKFEEIHWGCCCTTELIYHTYRWCLMNSLTLLVNDTWATCQTSFSTFWFTSRLCGSHVVTLILHRGQSRELQRQATILFKLILLNYCL